jgi:hypothetical protein
LIRGRGCRLGCEIKRIALWLASIHSFLYTIPVSFEEA